jgi:hypothetical protein
MKKLLRYILSVFLLTSCDRFFEIGGEEVLNDLALGIEPKLVVEAMVTELDTFQVVKLSTTKSMNAVDQNRLVKNATVQVRGGGETYIYQYVDLLESYLAEFKGKPGVEYTLEIDWNGKRYSARETMADLQHFDIDSIEIRKAKYDFFHWRYLDPDAPFRSFRDQEILISLNPEYPTTDTLIGGTIYNHNAVYINPVKRDEVLTTYKYGDLAEFWFGGDPYVIEAASEDKIMNVYKLYLHAKESQIESNFYRFDIKRKGKSWLHPGQLIIANDFALGANISGIEFPGFLVEGDEVEFIMYGISRKAYNYYLSLQSVLSNDGGNYSSIPGNPPTNVFDEEGRPALGYFEVNKVASVKKIVTAK